MQKHNLRQKVQYEEPLVRFETDVGEQMQVDWIELKKMDSRPIQCHIQRAVSRLCRKTLRYETQVCKPYRMQTKGKVKHFNHYFRYGFYNMLKTQLSLMGYKINPENTNAEVMDWLDFTANARMHATTLKPL